MDNKIISSTNTSFLKIIAIGSMLLDHIGKILYPNIIILQIIGRIAFPIFAYCISVGYLYTSNVKKYIFRLLIIGVLSQPVYIIAFDLPWYKLNIFFTLLIGLLYIHLIKKKHWYSLMLLLMVCLLLTFKVNYNIFSYTMIGSLLTLFFHLNKNKKTRSIFISSFILLICLPLIYQSSISVYNIRIPTQAFAIFSLPFIYTKTNFNIHINKYIFYIFYPLHLLILYLIKITN
jgi:hypothetical protein